MGEGGEGEKYDLKYILRGKVFGILELTMYYLIREIIRETEPLWEKYFINFFSLKKNRSVVKLFRNKFYQIR